MTAPANWSRWFLVHANGQLAIRSAASRGGAVALARIYGCPRIVFCTVIPDAATVIEVAASRRQGGSGEPAGRSVPPRSGQAADL